MIMADVSNQISVSAVQAILGNYAENFHVKNILVAPIMENVWSLINVFVTSLAW